MVQNNKKFCLSRSISEDPYRIWLSFTVHMSEITGSFFIFLWSLGGKSAKNGLKFQKIQSVALHISETIHHDCHLWYTYVKWHYLQFFFHFIKILIFQIVNGVKGQTITQNDKILWLSRCISQEPYIIWLSLMIHICKMITSPGIFFIFSKFWFSRLSGG